MKNKIIATKATSSKMYVDHDDGFTYEYTINLLSAGDGMALLCLANIRKLKYLNKISKKHKKKVVQLKKTTKKGGKSTKGGKSC